MNGEEMIRRDVQIAVTAAMLYVKHIDQVPGDVKRNNMRFDMNYRTEPVILDPI